jgi:glycerol-3-phosphate dehydrogenase
MADRLVGKIPYNATITTFAGVRAEPSTGDFIIRESGLKGFVDVAGVKSPGLSSAPAIAAYVADIVRGIIPGLRPKAGFDPCRRPRPVVEKLSEEGRAALVARDPRFGNIVCRCEMVTEGEIVDAIHRPAGARTLNGVKRRVRPGAGRCQGGFCSPRVLSILARELGLKETEIRQESAASAILVGESGGRRF